MLAGIMQPYFFPYLGYWNLISAVDKWYFFDLPRFAKKSWISRNRILHPDQSKEYSYITVPVVKGQSGQPIKDVVVNNNQAWRDEFRGKLTVYKRLGAPHYSDVCDIVDTVLTSDDRLLVDILERAFVAVRDYIGIDVNYSFVSRTAYTPEDELDAGDWARSISKHFGIDGYINPIGGVHLFDKSKYARDGIELQLLKPRLSPYQQRLGGSFVPGLSIIDALMFMNPEEVLDRVRNDYDVLTYEEAIQCVETS